VTRPAEGFLDDDFAHVTVFALWTQGGDRGFSCRLAGRAPSCAGRYERPAGRAAPAESAGQNLVPILEDGTAIFDSRVIVEYLDLRAGGDADPLAACGAVRDADGRRSRRRDSRRGHSSGLRTTFRPPELRSERWLDYQSDKVARGLAAFAAAPRSGRRDTAHIAFACALGYLDLRLAGAWRAEHPALVVWLDAFAADVAAFEATRPQK
jgi:glutathione S-transferase